MKILRQRMIEELNLFGFSPHTKRNYIEAVQKLSHYHGCAPDTLGEQDIKNFLLHCQRKGWAPSTMRNFRCGIDFFFTHVLHRGVEIQRIPSMKQEKRLPLVLSTSEIERILTSVENLKHKTIIMTFYGTGMRLDELNHFKVRDIDSSRMVIKIMGKGKKERYVPLSDILLSQLRNYWRIFKPSDIFFISARNKPYHRRSIAYVFEEVKKLAHITKPGGLHMLRHSYATHLYEAGVPIEIIQRLLGHSNIRTTMKYIYVAKDTITSVKSPLDLLSIDKILGAENA